MSDPGGRSPAETRALLARALQRSRVEPRAFPVSSAQERMWFLDRLAPGEATANMPYAVHVRGRLDVEVLRRALDRLVERHPMLRTSFDGTTGVPMQQVHADVAMPFRHVVLEGTDEERSAAAAQHLQREATTPFDLAVAPLVRTLVVERGPDEHEVMLTMHHLVSDAWSVAIIWSELGRVYDALLAGREPDLAPLRTTYADYAAWQREQLDGPEVAEQLAFWTEHLAGAPPVLELPTDHARPPVQSNAGRAVLFEIPADVIERLTATARAHQATLFMGLLAAFEVVLARYSGQDDLVVSTPVAGRSHPDLDDVVGLFVNTVPLRTSLAGDPTFATLLERVRESTLAALGHQDVPFEKLVEALAPDRNLAQAPLAQVQLTFQAGDGLPTATFAGTTTRSRSIFTRTAKLDLTAYAEVTAEGTLLLALEHRSDLFGPAWAERFADCLRSVVQHAAAEPGTRVGALRLLPPDRMAEVVAGPDAVPEARPVEVVHGSVLEALDALRRDGHGDEVEVHGRHERLSLTALLDWAARIGAVLRERGVVAETPVGLCLDRSPGMLAALLGVWAAGGAYVPLDPGFPAGRLAMMAEDAGLAHVVTEGALVELAAAVAPGARLLEVDALAVARATPLARPPSTHADQAAYTIFTSGSTGRPKGVTVPHGAVVNLVEAFQRALALGPDDCLVAVTTLSFDIALLELLLPLRAGATLVIADKREVADPDRLRQLLVQSGATVLQATPATWRMLLASGGVPATVRRRLCGGEALPRDLADELLVDGLGVDGLAVDGLGSDDQGAGGTELWNVYGPTETTIWSGAGLVDPSPAPVVVGPPIASTTLRVVDGALQAVPVGVVGELAIGGLGLARGYLGKPAMTADRFRPDPYAATPGARLYLTGDLVRRLEDGSLDVLGRIDHQVKLRGFRIEIGEIESVLGTHPAVQQAVAVVEAQGGEPYLAAYLVTTPGEHADLAAVLATHLRSSLPDYMVPAVFVELDELPLTPNAKVDRKALRRAAEAAGARATAAGSTATGVADVADEVLHAGLETEVAEIWRELLPAGATIGRRANFFALGGHSMTATRLVARVRATYGVTLPVRVVFTEPTVAGIAAALAGHPDFAGRLETAPLEPGRSTGDQDEPGGPDGTRGDGGPGGVGPAGSPGGGGSTGGTGGDDLLADLGEDEVEALLQALLARRRAKADAEAQAAQPPGGAASTPATEPEPEPVADTVARTYPASHAQRQLWFLDRLDPGRSTYTMAMTYRVTGRLDRDALAAAVDDLVARHAALRTTFATEGDEVVQVVHPVAAGRGPRLEHVTCATSAEAAERRETLGTQVFDLGGEGPLARLVLAATPDGPELSLAVHHALCDEWSLAILERDLVALHRARRDGVPPGLPAVERHLGDHALAEREPAGLARAAAALEHWAEHLAGAPELLELPTDRPRPAVLTSTPGTHRFRLPPEAAAAVAGLQAQGWTTYQVLAAALAVALSRTSGQDDLVIGSVIGRREDPALAEAVGMFVATVALRMRLDPHEPLSSVLARSRDVCLDALDHADAPFEEVTARVSPRRDPSYHPVFQVMYLVGPTTTDDADSPARDAGPAAEVALEPLALPSPGARFDLTLLVFEDPGGVRGRLDYNADLFDPGTVERLARLVARAVTALGTTPQAKVGDVALVDADERRLLTGARTPVEPAYAAGPLVPTLVLEQAARTPDADAVVDASGTSTYAELVARAGATAEALRRAGVQRGDVVGLVLPGGRDAVHSLLGVLLAGAAYLPLDGEQPPDRLRALLRHAGATAVLTSPAWRDRVDDGSRPVVDVGQLPRAGATVTAVDLSPDDAAYVIFTSGSTGEPKGVVVTHGGARNLALAFRDVHGFDGSDRLLALPPLFFDASVGDVLPALASGAALLLHPEPAALTGAGLMTWCAEHAVTTVDAPAALWQRWVEDLVAGPAARVPTSLVRMMVGGEAVPLHRVREWGRVTAGRVRLHNHYGPTEATVCATTYATDDGSELGDPADPATPEELPVGLALPNVRTYVLDRRGNPVPPGVLGELCLGGAGVARGYLGRPGATAAAFVPDPYAPEPGARMYRTGDLARWSRRGDLEFVGRRDGQVKIRGRRVELGEVEAALAALDDVREVAVTAPAAAGGSRRLVAHVVPTTHPAAGDGTDGGGDDVRRRLLAALRLRLPEHLVPSALVLHDALPLTRQGKVDRARLVDPEPADVDRPPVVAPRSETEQTIAAIWSAALDVDEVGVHDGFLDLGGHSLLAASVLARVNAACSVTLPLRAMFDASTLEQLAARVDAAATGDAPMAGRDDPVVDLRAEAVLPADVRVEPGARAPSRVERVLVTGATGFLGAFLVDGLLRSSDVTVSCLVRASSPEAGVERVQAALARYGLDPAPPGRLDVVLGDLAEPRLGLGPAVWERLAGTVDAVIHNGGQVSFVHPYERLRPANVDGTVEVLRLAATGRVAAVHHVSTLGVFLADAYAGRVVTEADAPDDPAGIEGGYNEAKWVADAMARQAAGRGLPVAIHRPARITGDSRTGRANTDDWFSSLLKACVEVGSVPTLAGREDMAPVDHVAATIVRLVLDGAGAGRAFHTYNARTTSYDEIAAALVASGFPVGRTSYAAWRADVLAGVADGTVTAFAPFAGLLPEPGAARAAEPEFDCRVSEAAAASYGLVCPPADEALLRRHLASFVETGFLARERTPA